MCIRSQYQFVYVTLLVFSFGMVLYEILTGGPPKDVLQYSTQPTLPQQTQQRTKYQALIPMFTWCTSLAPKDRPSLAQLLDAMSKRFVDS
jgi:hypothetical protein